MTQYQNQSIFISNLLAGIGYGEQLIAFRRKICRFEEDVFNKKIPVDLPCNRLKVGSKAEGLTGPFENDIDVMEVLMDTVCKEHSNSVTHENVHQFKLVFDHSRPGYSLLLTVHICNSLATATLLYESMIELPPDSLYLSSDFFKNEMKMVSIECSNLPENQRYVNVKNVTQGPSVVWNHFQLSGDFVVALKCECPTYVMAWVCRRRNYQWPPITVIREVSGLDSHVVPVGHTTSNVKYLEWRVCYTKGEIRLVHSLNDCLTKVLILLKQIAKITLKPLSTDMSSYLMKNVVFWLAELNDYNYFTIYALIVALKKALAYLKHFVVTNNFPSYMIPQRNLLEGKLTHSQRIKICMRIDSLLKEGPYMVLKIPKIRSAVSMYSRSSTEFSRFSRKLHEIQILSYLLEYFIHISIPQIPSTCEAIIRSAFSNRIVNLLQVRICLCLLDTDNVVLSYEDIKKIYDLYNNTEDCLRACDCENQLELHPCLL